MLSLQERRLNDAEFRLSVLVTLPVDACNATLYLQAVGDHANAADEVEGVLPTNPHRRYLQQLPLGVLAEVVAQAVAQAKRLSESYNGPGNDEDDWDRAEAWYEQVRWLQSICRGLFRCHTEHLFLEYKVPGSGHIEESNALWVALDKWVGPKGELTLRVGRD